MKNSLDKADMRKNPPNPSLKSWKQWFLIYPTFAIAVLGAVPQYINVVKGFVIGVNSNQVSYAENQHKLWMRNQDCHPTLNTIKTVANSEVSIGACPTGDIQVNIKYPNDSKFVRWIGFDELQKESLTSNVLIEKLGISAVLADEKVHPKLQLANSENKVICQKFLGNGKIVRIIRDKENCYREIINTYTGKVEEYKIVMCDTSC